MELGDTFVMGEGGHLWVVISNPALNREFIIVNITGDEFRAGRDCELLPGNHPFISKRSFVAYGDAKKVTPEAAVKLQAAIDAGAIRPRARMSKVTLDKIVAAGKTSKALREEYHVYL
ncbi:MAG TPA: hypothetical protein VGG14_04575 [Candidatus Sulfotelmatobacter sp.]|jgi:hypothetical protein